MPTSFLSVDSIAEGLHVSVSLCLHPAGHQDQARAAPSGDGSAAA